MGGFVVVFLMCILCSRLQLPLKIDIIKHPNETDGKSTAVHAKLLAPEDVTIYTYPCIPDYEDMRNEVRSVWNMHVGLLVSPPHLAAAYKVWSREENCQGFTPQLEDGL